MSNGVNPYLLGALALAGGLYWYSTTDSGQSAVSYVTDALANVLTPRGIRDNNPGNIRRNAIEWQGALSPDQVAKSGKSWDDAFVQFDTPDNGVRALGHVLRSYQSRGLSTVSAIISEWSATDQSAYIMNVSAALGVDPGATIDLQAQLPQLAAAIITQENGEQPYASNDLAQWVYA